MRRVSLHRLIWPYVAVLIAIIALAVWSAGSADARNVRGGTHQSIHSGARAGHAANRPAASHGANRAAPSRSSAAGRDANANRNTNTNRDVNRNRDVNVDRDVNIDVDVDHGWDHPIAAGAAMGTAAAITAAAIGSVVYSVPPNCAYVARYGVNYYQCGSVWYEPRYEGSSVTYVVVNPP